MPILESLGLAPKAPPRPGTIDTLLPLNPEVAERRSNIIHKDEDGRDRHQSVVNRLVAKQEALRAARANKAHHDAEFGGARIVNDLAEDGSRVEESVPIVVSNGPVQIADAGRHTTTSFIAGLDARIALAASEAERAERDAAEASAEWRPWSRLSERVDQYLRDYANMDGHGRIVLNRPEVSLSKGQTLPDLISSTSGKAISISQKLKATKSAYLPPDQTKAALLLDLGKRAAAPKVIIPNPASRGTQRHPYIKWAVDPLLGVESSNTNLVPSIDDALGALIWLRHDEMVEAINAQVDTAYASFEAQGILVLDAQERDARVKQLKAELLSVEHVLAEAIWQSGDAFPEWLDIRAILGIDGPEEPESAW